MKKLIGLALFLFSSLAIAETYQLTVYNNYKNIYESESGVTLIADDCSVTGYQDIILYLYNSGNYFSYLQDEDIVYCSVQGFAGLAPERVPKSQAIYDKTSNILYLVNIELWQNLRNTGDTIGFVQALYEDGVLKITEFEK